ncbi:peptidoglycan-binding protein, partial [Pseudomonadota bacterium]
MENQINTTSDSEVNGFNSYVDDYNSRCGSYRYRSGSLSSAKRSITNWSSTYAQEGRSRVVSWRSSAVSSSTAPSGSSQRQTYSSKPQPSKLVRDVQQILAALGYAPGPIDGLTGRKTAAAVMQFQSDYGFKVDGIVDQQLFSRVYELRPRDIVPQSST